MRESGEGARGVREICQIRCKFNPCGGEEGEKRVIERVLDYVVQFQEYFGKANVSVGGDIPPWTLSIRAHSWSGSLKQGYLSPVTELSVGQGNHSVTNI